MKFKSKTHSGAKKRFKKTASGKIKFSHSGKRHLLTKKTKKNKRQKRHAGLVGATDFKHIVCLLQN